MLNLAEFLLLERPLAVLDLETTGLNEEKDRICQIGVTVHYPSAEGQPVEPKSWASLINPEVPITNHKESHGITDEAVKDAPTWRVVAPRLAPKIMNVDIAGYNVDFDIKFLRAEFRRVGIPWPWAGHVVDSYVIYRKKHPLTLTNAYRQYGGDDGGPLPEGQTLEGAHDAGNDVAATEKVLRGQLLSHGDLPKTVKDLSLWCFPLRENAIDGSGKFVWNDKGEPCVTFGKHARNGPCPMRQIDKGYWQFLADKDFPQDCKEIMAAAAMGIYPTKSS